MLQLSTCTRCTGQFVAHAYDSQSNYVCVLCRPPSRAGKTRKVKQDIGEAATPMKVDKDTLSSSQWLADVMNGAHA
jgi:flagellar transcriptional activator FlhC